MPTARTGVAFTLAVLASGPAFATAAVFRSAGAIVISDVGTPPIPAIPYPSTIEVSGLPDALTGITVGFRELEHVSPRDVDVLLVAPSGATAILMSDACGLVDMVNVNLVFDDGAPGPLPQVTPPGCAAGGYQPTDYTPADDFPAPAPPAPWGSTLAGFLGASPDGTWSLYVVDDLSVGEPAGRIEWWTLTLTTDPGPLFLDGFETGNLVRWSSAVP
jgi:hypothetical protein